MFFSLSAFFVDTGVLEANFVKPAHDKQGFERTIVLARLEARLQAMQKKYWYATDSLFNFISLLHLRSFFIEDISFTGLKIAKKLVMLSAAI